MYQNLITYSREIAFLVVLAALSWIVFSNMRSSERTARRVKRENRKWVDNKINAIVGDCWKE